MRLQVRKGWWAPSSTKGVQILTLFSPDLSPAYHIPNSKFSIAPGGKKEEVGTTSPSPSLTSRGLMILMIAAVPGRAPGSWSPEHLGGGHPRRVERQEQRPEIFGESEAKRGVWHGPHGAKEAQGAGGGYVRAAAVVLPSRWCLLRFRNLGRD